MIKNKAMGSLTIAKDGTVLYTRAIGYSQINGSEKKVRSSWQWLTVLVSARRLHGGCFAT